MPARRTHIHAQAARRMPCPPRTAKWTSQESGEGGWMKFPQGTPARQNAVNPVSQTMLDVDRSFVISLIGL